MALIIHNLSTDQAEQYGATPTICLQGTEQHHMLTMSVTLEEPEDVPALQQFIDAFISRHTTILPDYQAITFPLDRMLFLTIFTGNVVFISFYERGHISNTVNYQYRVPTAAQRVLSNPTRDRGHLENSN